MNILKLEEFVDNFNSGRYDICNQLIDEIIDYNERDFGEALRKFILSINKINAGNIGGARVTLDEASRNFTKFRSLLDKHLPGVLRNLKEMQKEIKSGKVNIQNLKFRK